ncbi:hypothetical protein [Pseudomonas tumuqii]|uniref:hypothetical protein n=1 Tax=Pseudomonas tumuqii TaxID=2715755 RepID=UPI001557462A|nr:hypothetical protein [Pseudomonas tumuqii]
MEELDYWRLCEDLNIIQAALLTVGTDPSSEPACYCEDLKVHERPYGYEAAKSAITSALRRGSLEGTISQLAEYDMNGNFLGWIEDSVDLKESMVKVDALREWLAGRGFQSGFFFPIRDVAPISYLDQSNACYAPKLAAAIRAWEAVTSDPERLRGKTPKAALSKWLNEHAASYGLIKDDGMPNASGVEEAAKLANWKPEGGASKTLSE